MCMKLTIILGAVVVKVENMTILSSFEINCAVNYMTVILCSLLLINL